MSNICTNFNYNRISWKTQCIFLSCTVCPSDIIIRWGFVNTRVCITLGRVCSSAKGKSGSDWVAGKGHQVINRPGVAGAVLQSPLLLINSLIKSAFSSKPSKHHYTQTVRARELNFWENVHPPPSVTFQVSCVTCQVSCVRCHVSGITCQVSGVRCPMSVVTC